MAPRVDKTIIKGTSKKKTSSGFILITGKAHWWLTTIKIHSAVHGGRVLPLLCTSAQLGCDMTANVARDAITAVALLELAVGGFEWKWAYNAMKLEKKTARIAEGRAGLRPSPERGLGCFAVGTNVLGFSSGRIGGCRGIFIAAYVSWGSGRYNWRWDGNRGRGSRSGRWGRIIFVIATATCGRTNTLLVIVLVIWRRRGIKRRGRINLLSAAIVATTHITGNAWKVVVLVLVELLLSEPVVSAYSQAKLKVMELIIAR